MTNFVLFIATVVLFLASLASIFSYRQIAISFLLVDKPNNRSSHHTAKPTGAGIIFISLWLILVCFVYYIKLLSFTYFILLAPTSFFLSAVGFVDDIITLPSSFRFTIHVLLSVFVVFYLHGLQEINVGLFIIKLSWLGLILTAIGIVWSINLFNFMDGTDGIATIQSIFIFLVGGWLFKNANGEHLALIMWSIIPLLLGFLYWNKPPSSIFMGDAGSYTLGFLAIIFGLIGDIDYKIPILIWLILYGIFWFDATITLFRRILYKQKWHQPHRLHAYQRMQLQGWTHKKILLWAIGINCLLSCIAILAFEYQRYLIWLFFVAVSILSLLYWLVEKKVPFAYAIKP